MFLAVGCGGGSGGDSSDNTPNQATPTTGQFIDSPVQGLRYQTATQSGTTDELGTFQYLEGETIIFRLGTLELGQAPGEETITPVDLVEGATDSSNAAVVNICRLLQTLDDDGNPDNGITITDKVQNLLNGIQFSFSNMTEFNSQIDTLLVELNGLNAFLTGFREVVSEEDAREHFEEFLNNYNPSQVYDEDGINYKVKAYNLVDRIYAAKSADEIETLIKEIMTILGVPVYNHNNTAIVAGSGSLTQGMALRDYQVYILADSILRYIKNPNHHTKAKTFADGVQNLGGDNGPVSLKFLMSGETKEFDEGMVFYMAGLYDQLCQTMGFKRQYFLASLFTALSDKTPKHKVTGNFYLDPLQAFLMKLDWFSKPLNPPDYSINYLTYTGGLPIQRDALSQQAGVTIPIAESTKSSMDGGMDTVKGYWSIAQAVAGEAVDSLGKVLDVGGMVAGEITADGTQISIDCDTPLYYGSGEHTITISVVFEVDLNKFATDYGWVAGVDLPEKGPIKRAKVSLANYEVLAPRHGVFSNGNLNVLRSLAAGGAIADDKGQVSVNFTLKEQGTTTCDEEDEEPVELLVEVNPITDPTAWQPGIVNSIWPRSMTHHVDVRWKKSTSECSGSTGGGNYSN